MTGRFPKHSSRRNEYIFVGYHYNTNCILGVLIKNRRGGTITKAWEKLHIIFKKAGALPETYILDNKISRDLINGFNQESINYQLVTLYNHRNNQAERAIQTFKAHFKSCLATVNPNFPLSEWDRLIL